MQVSRCVVNCQPRMQAGINEKKNSKPSPKLLTSQILDWGDIIPLNDLYGFLGPQITTVHHTSIQILGPRCCYYSLPAQAFYGPC